MRVRVFQKSGAPIGSKVGKAGAKQTLSRWKKAAFGRYQKFNVTSSIQVASYEVSEKVDGTFVGTDDKGKSTTYWLAGVVFNKRAATAQLAYEVFWLGYPPKKSGINQTPTWSSVHILRRHIEGTGAGTDTDWLNVEKVRNVKIGPVVNNDIPKEPAAGASHVSSSTDSNSCIKPTENRT
jgi:hypothetical protein